MISGRGLLNMGLNEDEVDQSSIRPESLDEFIGQHLLKKILVFLLVLLNPETKH